MNLEKNMRYFGLFESKKTEKFEEAEELEKRLSIYLSQRTMKY